MAYTKKCDWQNVYTFASRAVDVDPKHFKSLYRRGVALRHLGRMDECKRDLELALQLEDSPDVRRELSLCSPITALLHLAQFAETPREQISALKDLICVVAFNPVNQSAAGANAVDILLRLAESDSIEADVQTKALLALCFLVRGHPVNQCAVGERAVHVLLQMTQLARFKRIVPNVAETRGCFVDGCFFNQRVFYNAVSSLHSQRKLNVPVELQVLVSNALKTFTGRHEDGCYTPSLLDQFEAWCQQGFEARQGPCQAADDPTSVETADTQQLGGTCYAFAAVRSFNRR